MRKQVSKDEFYSTVGKLNVHPCPRREFTEWVMQDGSRRVVGVSIPGYANHYCPTGKTPEQFTIL